MPGKRVSGSKSKMELGSDDEDLLSPFEDAKPRHSIKRRVLSFDVLTYFNRVSYILFILTALQKSIRIMSKTTLELSSWLIKLLGHPSFRLIIIGRFRILIYLFSEASPREDESDIGKRDKMLKKTYKGLVNLR